MNRDLCARRTCHFRLVVWYNKWYHFGEENSSCLLLQARLERTSSLSLSR